MTVESNIVIAISALHDWLKSLMPVFQPLRRKTKTNHTSYVQFFLHFKKAENSDLLFVLVMTDGSNYFRIGFLTTTLCKRTKAI